MKKDVPKISLQYSFENIFNFLGAKPTNKLNIFESPLTKLMDGDRYLGEDDLMWFALAVGVEIFCQPTLKTLSKNINRVLLINALDEFTDKEKTRIMSYVIGSGDFAAVDLLYQHGFPFPWKIEKYAAKSGNLDLVKFLATQVQFEDCSWAYKYGQKHILEWMISKGITDSTQKDVCGGDYEKFTDVVFKHYFNADIALWQFRKGLIDIVDLCMSAIECKNDQLFNLSLRMVGKLTRKGQKFLLNRSARRIKYFKKVFHLCQNVVDTFSGVFAGRGNIAGLKFMKKHNIKISQSICSSAARHDHLHVLQWAVDNGEAEPLYDIILFVESYKTLKFILYDLNKNNDEITFGDDDYWYDDNVDEVIEKFVSKSDVRGLKLLKKEGYIWGSCLDRAIYDADNLYILKQFFDKTEYDMEEALLRDSTRIIREMVRNGEEIPPVECLTDSSLLPIYEHPFEEEQMIYAICERNIHTVKWLIEQDCPLSERCMTEAIEYGALAIVCLRSKQTLEIL